MQTFLPYPDFVESAKCLDDKRLGKQRVECLQLLNALLADWICKKCETENHAIDTKCIVCGKVKPWVNHPATKMWKGFEISLLNYSLDVCMVWQDRGKEDTCMDKLYEFGLKHHLCKKTPKTIYEFLISNPPWLGDERFHASHRSNLLRKDAGWYGQFGWKEPENLPYFWPTKQGY